MRITQNDCSQTSNFTNRAFVNFIFLLLCLINNICIIEIGLQFPLDNTDNTYLKVFTSTHILVIDTIHGAVVRALASHQCGPGSNPGVDAICGLSLLLVLSLAPRGFSPGATVFPSPQKSTQFRPIRSGTHGHV